MITISDHRKLQGARKIVEVCADLNQGEKVLILGDTHTVRIGELLAITAMQISGGTALTILEPRSSHGEEPPPHIAPTLKQSDVVFMPLTYSMTHASIVEKARDNGTRVISMGDFTERMLESGGIRANFPKLKKVVDKVAGILTDGQTVQLRTKKGTDISMDISGREGNSEPGLAHTPGSFSSPPNMEANVGPKEETATGKLVIDASITSPELRKVDDPITAIVEGGEIVAVQGGSQAEVLEKVLRQIEDPNIYNIAELGIGLNPCSSISGRMLEDEGVYKTAHIGIGDNLAYGGQVRAQGHIDLVMWRPTIAIDGSTIQEEGKLTIDLGGLSEYK